MIGPGVSGAIPGSDLLGGARRVAWAVASRSLAQPHSSLLVSSQAPYVRIMTSPSASCSVTSTIWSATLITATESAPPAGVGPMCSWTV